MEYNFRTVLRRFRDELNEAGGMEYLSAVIIRRVCELLPVDRIGFFIVKEGAGRLQLLAHEGFGLLEKHGPKFQSEKLKSSLSLPVALEGCVEPGVSYEPADAGVFRRWGLEIVFPMKTDSGEVLGFLAVGGKQSRLRFTGEDIDLLATIALEAGLSLQRTILRRRLTEERLAARRLKRVNEQKSYFISSVSHDLKTPLASIRMFAELIRTQKHLSASRVDEYLRIIEGESERLSRLVGNVLDFARVERGVREYHFSDIVVDDLVRRVVTTMQYQLEAGHFRLRSRLRAGDVVIRGDGDAITESLINLVSNSMKYSGDSREIRISTFLKEGVAAVQVSDRGIGIPADELGRIFEPYYRAPSGVHSSAGGVGLGLSIVKHVVDAHHGRIDVDSAPGVGTEFTLSFPLAEPSEVVSR